MEPFGLVELNTNAFEQLDTLPLKEVATLYREYNELPKNEKVDGNVLYLKFLI